MNKKVSVLTTLFNHERFIKDTLESALQQSTPPSEIIVLDDASTDKSLEIAKSVNSPSIRVIPEIINLGGSNTVAGLNACNNELIAILNSDDLWTPQKLEKQLTRISSSSQIGAVFTHVTLIDENGKAWDENSIRHQYTFDIKNRSRYEWLRYFFVTGNPFCASSALIRKECFDRLGTLNGSYIQLQDLDMWIRITLAGYDINVIEEPLTQYRVMRSGKNMSTGYLAQATNSFEYAKILRHYWNISSLQELQLVFPEIDISDKADDSLTLFYLAKYAAKLPSIHHQLFALETMSAWGGNKKSMDLAYRCHKFDFQDYQDFFTHGPIRQLLQLNIRHFINKIAFKILPYSSYQRIKMLFLKRRST